MSKQKSQIISALRHLLPPDAVVDVGIGTGNGEMHQWCNWEVPLALLVDAEPDRVEWLYDWVEQRNGWQLATVLLADNTSEQDFFVPSNKAESGVIAIEQLQQIWPNMQLKEQKVLPAQRLQNLLLSPSSQALREASCIWGIVDCLPALPVLKGASDELKQWSVLWVRVALDEVFSDSEQQNYNSLMAITDFLSPLGYRCVEVIEENHPALGYALFIQDWHKHYEALLLENVQIKQVHQQQLQGCDYRQKLLDEEFIKTEAQIELIKDVLLKEKAF